jgi:cobalt-zinc-cadmium efflux system outer membrane protein
MQKNIRLIAFHLNGLCEWGARRSSPASSGKGTGLKIMLVGASLLAGCFTHPHYVSGQPLLDNLIREGLSNNSELQSLEKNVRALELEVPFYGSLQDPVLGIGVANLPVDSFKFDQEPMTQKTLFISQKFPWFGTLELNQQVAGLKALEARSRLQSSTLDLRKQISALFYEINSLYRQVDLVVSLQDLVTRSLRVAESRYSTGKGSQQDVLAGQVQLTELIREDVDLQSKLRASQARLAILLNRQGRLFERQELRIPLTDRPAPLPALDTIVEKGLAHSPVLEEKKLVVDRLRVELKLVRTTYFPDFDLRLSYGQREDDPATGNERADFFSATLAMTLPLYRVNRQDVKLAGAEKRLQAGIRSLDGLRDNFSNEVLRLTAEIEGLQENYTLLQDTLTVQAAYLAEANLAAYSVGKVDFSTMLSSRMSLQRLQSKADVTAYQVYKAHAELELLAGVPLFSGE